eukprot:m.31020 g.31020  ORF g.31020 m.31020 type:complete len:351 (+) comp5292_c0_seq1:243-1295(+)
MGTRRAWRSDRSRAGTAGAHDLPELAVQARDLSLGLGKIALQNGNLVLRLLLVLLEVLAQVCNLLILGCCGSLMLLYLLLERSQAIAHLKETKILLNELAAQALGLGLSAQQVLVHRGAAVLACLFQLTNALLGSLALCCHLLVGGFERLAKLVCFRLGQREIALQLINDLLANGALLLHKLAQLVILARLLLKLSLNLGSLRAKSRNCTLKVYTLRHKVVHDLLGAALVLLEASNLLPKVLSHCLCARKLGVDGLELAVMLLLQLYKGTIGLLTKLLLSRFELLDVAFGVLRTELLGLGAERVNCLLSSEQLALKKIALFLELLDAALHRRNGLAQLGNGCVVLRGGSR